MDTKIVGLVVRNPDPKSCVAEISEMDDMGIPAVWMTTGGGGGDSITIYAAAALETKRILMGTAIAHNWAKAPRALVSQAEAFCGLAPGRLRLGLGTSAKVLMERSYGADFDPPLGHLKEYVQILRTLLSEGSIDFNGKYYRTRARITQTLEVPVMISALRAKSFELAGAETDGAITWVCPYKYLQEVAMPAMAKGAAQQKRPTPPMIVHVPVCVHKDIEEAREGMRQLLGYYPGTPVFGKMFEEAGFPGSQQTGWTDEMISDVLVTGSEDHVAKALEDIFAWGAGEIMVDVVKAGPNPEASKARTTKLIADVVKSYGSGLAQ